MRKVIPPSPSKCVKVFESKGLSLDFGVGERSSGDAGFSLFVAFLGFEDVKLWALQKRWLGSVLKNEIQGFFAPLRMTVFLSY
jgi:hypothetical protein